MLSHTLLYLLLTIASEFIIPNQCGAFQLRTISFSSPSPSRTAGYRTQHHRRRSTSTNSVMPGDGVINGERQNSNSITGSNHPFSFLEGIDVAALPEGGELLPESPPMSFNKFLTMQEKRAIVTIRYSGDAGLKPYFLTIAKKLKTSHPDVMIERLILPAVADGNEATFEVLVDGKVVIGKSRPRKVARGVVDMHVIGRRSIYVSMSELDLSISRARRKHRPSTVYGDDNTINNKNRSNPISNSSNSKNVEPGKTKWSD
jgi:hypothetical protein